MRKSNSYGIILLNYNKKKKQYEILMIRKKYTYNYKDFVLGTYDIKNYKNLFDKMTQNEKEYICTNNYDFMWYKLWLKFPSQENFNHNRHLKKLYLYGKNIYFNNFPSNDGKINKELLESLNKSQNSEVLWEFPKGAKKLDESNIDAAIREFEEETNINYIKYRILWYIPPINIIMESNNTIYNYYYYLATLSDTFTKINEEHNSFNLYKNLSEVSKVKWISISDIKLLNVHPKLKKKLIGYVRKSIKLYIKNKKNDFL
jgi:8-oxo-dGTP pyrophosphatase MutT (NUDIX family)